MSVELAMPSNHHILCRPLLLPSIFPSIRVFSNESTLRVRWPKYWSFSFSISPSNEHSGLMSFRMNWLDCSPRDSRVFALNQSLINYSQRASPAQCVWTPLESPFFSSCSSLSPSSLSSSSCNSVNLSG